MWVFYLSQLSLISLLYEYISNIYDLLFIRGPIPAELNGAFAMYFIRGDVLGLCSPFLWPCYI